MTGRRRFVLPIEARIRRGVTGGLIIAVLLTGFLGYSYWHSARRAEQDAYWVAHTYEVIGTIQRTARQVLEAETSARAFALSGQEPLLVHYQTARDTIYQDEGALRHLTADNLSQQRRLDVVETQVLVALEFADSIGKISLSRSEGFSRDASWRSPRRDHDRCSGGSRNRQLVQAAIPDRPSRFFFYFGDVETNLTAARWSAQPFLVIWSVVFQTNPGLQH
jgi:hypothetical protein